MGGLEKMVEQLTAELNAAKTERLRTELQDLQAVHDAERKSRSHEQRRAEAHTAEEGMRNSEAELSRALEEITTLQRLRKTQEAEYEQLARDNKHLRNADDQREQASQNLRYSLSIENENNRILHKEIDTLKEEIRRASMDRATAELHVKQLASEVIAEKAEIEALRNGAEMDEAHEMLLNTQRNEIAGAFEETIKTQEERLVQYQGVVDELRKKLAATELERDQLAQRSSRGGRFQEETRVNYEVRVAHARADVEEMRRKLRALEGERNQLVVDNTYLRSVEYERDQTHRNLKNGYDDECSSVRLLQREVGALRAERDSLTTRARLLADGTLRNFSTRDSPQQYSRRAHFDEAVINVDLTTDRSSSTRAPDDSSCQILDVDLLSSDVSTLCGG